MELVIETNPSPERYLLSVAGEIDIWCADKLREAIDYALAQPAEKISCSISPRCPMSSSTGIGVLVGAAHHAHDGGKGFESH